MRRDDALRILREHADEIRRRGVKSLSIFGSTARDEARADSDVDIVVEIDENAQTFGLIELIDLKHYLESILKTRVDLGEPESLHPAFKREALREAIRAA
jgi:predicted nucleotidyltransferase